MGGYEAFVGRLIRGECPEPSSMELDALLHWLVRRSNKASRSIESAFKSYGVSSDAARNHTLLYLDSTLFNRADDYYRLFGLTPDCDFSDIRSAHKRMMQILHPDRHSANDREWFTKKAEQVNEAYAYLRMRHNKPRTGEASTVVPPPPTGPRKVARPKRSALRNSWHTVKHGLRGKLKAYIGNPAVFERRLFFLLYTIPVLLVVIVYLNRTSELQHPATVVSLDRSYPDKEVTVPELPSGGPKSLHEPLERSTSSVVNEYLPVKVDSLTMPNLPDLEGQPRVDRHPLKADADDLFDDADNVSVGASRTFHPDKQTDTGKLFRKQHDSSGRVTDEPMLVRLPGNSDTDPASALSDIRGSPTSPPAQKHSEKAAPPGSHVSESATSRGTRTEDQLSEMATLSTTEHPKQTDDHLSRNSVNGIEWAYQDAPSSELSIEERTEPTADLEKVNYLSAVETLLDKYQLAYNVSNIERLSSLFRHDAVTGGVKGRPQITKTYLSVFDNTSKRKLVIEDTRVKTTGPGQFDVTAKFSVDWIYKDGGRRSDTGRLEMRLVMVEDEARIQTLDYLTQ